MSDLTNLILKSAYSKIRGKIYNVAGGKEIKVNKIAKLIGGKKVFIPKRPGEPDRSLADIYVKLKKILIGLLKISIEKGVKDLLNKIDYWKSAPVWTPSKITKATKIWFDLLKKK